MVRTLPSCYALLLLCCTLCLTRSSATRVQSISEAREELLERQARAAGATANPATTPNSEQSGYSVDGIFGNQSMNFLLPDCFMMGTRGVRITAQDLVSPRQSLDTILLFNATADITGKCSPMSTDNGTAEANVTIAFTSFPNQNVTSASFQIFFTQDRFNWYITELTLSAEFTDATGKDKKKLTDVPLSTNGLFASRGASYYCNSPVLFRGMNGTTTQLSLYFLDLIVEPFVNSSLGYSPIENCEYAFGIGIWMGILTALVMGVILGLGITMLSSIRNMDRFDDPKSSKLLSVPSE